MKRVLLCACIVALAGCRKKVAPHTIGLALDVGGRGDQSFNDGALRGLEAMAAGLKYKPRGYEPLSDDEYKQILPGELLALKGPLPHIPMPPPIVLSGTAQEDYEPKLQLLV